ncbi:DUF423 domain-containing protein [Crocinitomicaceae bacterium]|nr:DUF423 domain-containing protein [Crocinitomicaceae bacterium]
MNKTITISGVILITLSIVLGAMAAHALKEVLEAKELASFETGVRYAMYHGLAFLVLGITADRLHKLTWSYRLILSGVILFSGSIFLLSLQSLLGVSLKFLGPVTPLGGILMISGWAFLLISLLKKR